MLYTFMEFLMRRDPSVVREFDDPLVKLGIDLNDPDTLKAFQTAMKKTAGKPDLKVIAGQTSSPNKSRPSLTPRWEPPKRPERQFSTQA